MADFLYDSFTGSSGAAIDARTGETGATWAKVFNNSSASTANLNDAMAPATFNNSAYYASGVPASADYDVVGNVYRNTSGADCAIGLIGRCSTTVETFYYAQWWNGNWYLYKCITGTHTQLGSSYADSFPSGSTRTAKLEMRGTAIKLFVDGVARISVTDSSITAAGRAGARFYTGSGAAISLLDITATDAAAGAPTLTVSDGTHGHTTDAIVLSTLGTLAIADGTHGHTTDSITLTAVTNGVITIPGCTDWETGLLKTSETGVQVDIRNKATGALVVRKTGQTTHATTADCVVSDASITAGTTYEVTTRFADGSIGIWDYAAS